MKSKVASLLGLACSTGISFGAAGMFDQFLFTTTTGSAPLSFYDIGATTGNPDFQGNDLGVYSVGDSLFVGGQQKSFKNNGTDVFSHGLAWRVYSGSPSGSFTTVNMPFQFDIGGGDQQWGGDSQGAHSDPIEVSTNVLQGLAPGSYTLDVYSFITTNGVNESATVFNNVGGNNYQATFTVIPEPSAALLGGLGLIGLLRRRR